MKEKHASIQLQSSLALQTLREQELIPSTQELDAFRMKAITLLKHHEINFSSFTEQLNLIRAIPIEIEKHSHAKTIIAMQQTISIFPGETIKLKGSFKRYPESHCRSIPIPESFLLDTQSQQTGFPHPSQHHGWALSPLLLPKDEILMKKREDIALKLMPKGSLNSKAKELLKLKQQSFQEHLEEFLELHHRLHRAILKASNLKESSFDFFAPIKTHPNPYLCLSSRNEQVITQYIEKSSSIEDHSDYISLMGIASQQILKINKPLYEALTVKQMQEFIWELEEFNTTSSKDMYQWLRKMLMSDIELFSPLQGW